MLRSGVSAALALLLAACVSRAPEPVMPVSPVRIVSITHYDGVSNDLLSAGLGLAGIQSATAPEAAIDDAEAIRRRAIYMHYRGLIDRTPGGGFGRLFGTALQSGIAGTELLAQIPWRAQTFTAVLQIPAGFDRNAPCLVVAPASGSRNAYGALPIVGEWALPHGCALLLHDKGVAAGVATASMGLDARGRVVSPAQAAWQAKTGWQEHDGVAFRHLHDGADAEADWGRMTLAAIRWAMQALNEQLPAGHHYRKPALTIIAAGISNGGAAVLRAAEADDEQFIDAVVAGEPNITPAHLQTVQVGEGAPQQVGLPALTQFPEVGLLLPCAISTQPLPPTLAQQAQLHCRWLREQGMLTGVDDNALAHEASARIRALGLPDSVFALAPITLSLGMHQSLLATYVNAAAGSPTPAICEVRVQPPQAPLDAVGLARQFTDGSGLPPQDWLGAGGLSPAQQWCLRQSVQSNATVAESLAKQAGTGQLGTRPVLIVHGRDDALIAVQHSSRPYYGLLQQTAATAARYIEVTHAHHFDAFNGLPGYDRMFVPLHLYFLRAMDAMWAHLKTGAALPSSQVVHTRLRTGSSSETEALSLQHVPMWQQEPGTDAAIRWQDGLLYIPK
ncbi:3-hydroxybutyrate oligomer hydrolase family protein [Permianibacter fluminis]|uniref:3-hydroxybutyrate oligomer hydrolase family protein n=1 Tax=Permianibacter fluminis TaxID=2738515 RepID=UPI0038B321C6